MKWSPDERATATIPLVELDRLRTMLHEASEIQRKIRNCMDTRTIDDDGLTVLVIPPEGKVRLESILIDIFNRTVDEDWQIARVIFEEENQLNARIVNLATGDTFECDDVSDLKDKIMQLEENDIDFRCEMRTALNEWLPMEVEQFKMMLKIE